MCISPKSINTPLKSAATRRSCTQRKDATKQVHRHVVVQHDYHDHASDPDPYPEKTIEDASTRRGVNVAFPLKLYDMLSRVEEDGIAHIVAWQPHGRCFVVHKPQEFKKLLPTYFMQSKLSSFQRQLNLYGFSRLTRGKDRNGYYNELFLRGRPLLASQIRRVKVKGTGVRGKANPEAEPDLWSMTWMPADGEIRSFPPLGSVSPSQSVSPTHTLDEDSDSCSDIPMPPLLTREKTIACSSFIPMPSLSQAFEGNELMIPQSSGRQDSSFIMESVPSNPSEFEPASHDLGNELMIPQFSGMQDSSFMMESVPSNPSEFEPASHDVALEWGMPFQYIDSFESPNDDSLPTSSVSPIPNQRISCIDLSLMDSVDLDKLVGDDDSNESLLHGVTV